MRTSWRRRTASTYGSVLPDVEPDWAAVWRAVVYCSPWNLFIEAVNAALIVSILWFTWPSETLVGA